MTQKRWTEFVVSASDAEERSPFLFEQGAQGIEILSKTKLRAFFDSPPQGLISSLTENGFMIDSEREIKQENWTGACAEIWDPVHIGSLAVQPVQSIEAGLARRPTSNELLIIPGLGFGTGHHRATQNILHLLQEIPRKSVSRALDVGTGSGILAIAIEKLFNVPVLAVDTDPLALENAADNLTINRSTKIELREGSLDSVEGEFDLIVANLYAEILISLSGELIARLPKSGNLVLSGIMESLKPQVEAAFPSRPKRERSEEGWSGLLYSK